MKEMNYTVSVIANGIKHSFGFFRQGLFKDIPQPGTDIIKGHRLKITGKVAFTRYFFTAADQRPVFAGKGYLEQNFYSYPETNYRVFVLFGLELFTCLIQKIHAILNESRHISCERGR
ncbi:hypothetical protein OIM82_21335 [Escherichia coli]|nr:hypothetical protein [Escherichia coli]